jgi:hypothetical protein
MNTGPLFIQPGPDAHPVKPSPPKFGPCQWVVDPENNIECGAEGVAKIKADSRVQAAQFPVCLKHKAENNQRFAERRTKNKS